MLKIIGIGNMGVRTASLLAQAMPNVDIWGMDSDLQTLKRYDTLPSLAIGLEVQATIRLLANNVSSRIMIKCRHYCPKMEG